MQGRGRMDDLTAEAGHDESGHDERAWGYHLTHRQSPADNFDDIPPSRSRSSLYTTSGTSQRIFQQHAPAARPSPLSALPDRKSAFQPVDRQREFEHTERSSFHDTGRIAARSTHLPTLQEGTPYSTRPPPSATSPSSISWNPNFVMSAKSPSFTPTFSAGSPADSPQHLSSSPPPPSRSAIDWGNITASTDSREAQTGSAIATRAAYGTFPLSEQDSPNAVMSSIRLSPLPPPSTTGSQSSASTLSPPPQDHNNKSAATTESLKPPLLPAKVSDSEESPAPVHAHSLSNEEIEAAIQAAIASSTSPATDGLLHSRLGMTNAGEMDQEVGGSLNGDGGSRLRERASRGSGSESDRGDRGSGRGDMRNLPPRDTRTLLFVGNLPYRVRWQDLKDLFRRAGTVLRADVSLGPDNRSRGYGTVLLATGEEAGRAIDMLNGYEWQTRILEVRIDRVGIAGMMDATTGGMSAMSNMGGMPAMGQMAGGMPMGLGGQSGMGTSYDSSLMNMGGYGSASMYHHLLPSFQQQQQHTINHRPGLDPLARQQHILQPTPVQFHNGIQSATQYGAYSFPQANSPAWHTTSASSGSSSWNVPGRTLFVGNLPYHVQWQDLKDLFKRIPSNHPMLLSKAFNSMNLGGSSLQQHSLLSGSPLNSISDTGSRIPSLLTFTVLRADVALGPDGRSKGFGTVVFATQEEAEYARKIFSGYEFNGRQLKVHFDRMSGASADPNVLSQPSYLPSTSSQHTAPVSTLSVTQQMLKLGLRNQETERTRSQPSPSLSYDSSSPWIQGRRYQSPSSRSASALGSDSSSMSSSGSSYAHDDFSDFDERRGGSAMRPELLGLDNLEEGNTFGMGMVETMLARKSSRTKGRPAVEGDASSDFTRTDGEVRGSSRGAFLGSGASSAAASTRSLPLAVGAPFAKRMDIRDWVESDSAGSPDAGSNGRVGRVSSRTGSTTSPSESGSGLSMSLSRAGSGSGSGKSDLTSHSSPFQVSAKRPRGMFLSKRKIAQSTGTDADISEADAEEGACDDDDSDFVSNPRLQVRRAQSQTSRPTLSTTKYRRASEAAEDRPLGDRPRPGPIQLPPPPPVLPISITPHVAERSTSVAQSFDAALGGDLFQQYHPFASGDAVHEGHEYAEYEYSGAPTIQARTSEASHTKDQERNASQLQVNTSEQTQSTWTPSASSSRQAQAPYDTQQIAPPTPQGLPIMPSVPPFTLVSGRSSMSPRYQARQERLQEQQGRRRYGSNAPGTLTLPPSQLQALYPGQQQPGMYTQPLPTPPSYIHALGSPGSPYALGPHHPLHRQYFHQYMAPSFGQHPLAQSSGDGQTSPGSSPAHFMAPGGHHASPIAHPMAMIYPGHPAQVSPMFHPMVSPMGLPVGFGLGAMSPGAFWGRPGEVNVGNPYINPAVGAPVLLGSVGSPPQQGSATGEVMAAQAQMMQEPKGYFDQLYIAPGYASGYGALSAESGAVGGGVKSASSAGSSGSGQSAIEREILKDKHSLGGESAVSLDDTAQTKPVQGLGTVAGVPQPQERIEGASDNSVDATKATSD